MKVNLGCGNSFVNGYLNCDNSPSIRISKVLALGFILRYSKIISEKQYSYIKWLKNNKIVYADAKKLPFNTSSVDVLYSSHMFEHLSRYAVDRFLNEAYRVLSNEGIMRLAIPDLRKVIEDYNQNKDANNFMQTLDVIPSSNNSFVERLKFLITGFRNHQWMYDEDSIVALLKKYKFKNIRVLTPGETTIREYGNLDLYERKNESIYIECTKGL